MENAMLKIGNSEEGRNRKPTFWQRILGGLGEYRRVCRMFGPYLTAMSMVILLFSLFAYFVPLESTSVSVYAGITLLLAGLLSLAYPLRWIGIKSRKVGLLVFLGGIALFLIALQWPASIIRITGRQSAIDDFLPVYHFYERHEVRIRATPERTASVFKQVTFDEIGVFHALMRLRALAAGRCYHGAPMGEKPILEVMTAPTSGFVILHEDPREIVLVTAGRPWTSDKLPHPGNRVEFENYRIPASVRIACNLRIEAAGAGESRFITETRVQATDEEGARLMAPYWRLIYPGSGWIRRAWLNAIRDRAEQPSTINQ
jgi:hypothetical protein